MELTEEDQMLQAIAMSLGENAQVSASSTSQRSVVAKPPPELQKEVDDEPLSKVTLGK